MLKFVLCLSLFVFIEAGVVTFIDPCNVGDSNCIMTSATKALPYIVNGIPELGVPSANPLVLDGVVSDNGQFKITFNNMIVKGIEKCKIIKIERPEYLKASMEIECPITVIGDYKMEGKLFFIDATGEGPCEIKTEKVKIEVDINLNKVQKDGQDYYKIKSFNYKYLPEEKFYFKFDNLFNEDKAKAEPIEKILDEKWEVLVKEVGQPVVKEVITKCVNVVDKFFSALPANEADKS